VQSRLQMDPMGLTIAWYARSEPGGAGHADSGKAGFSVFIAILWLLSAHGACHASGIPPRSTKTCQGARRDKCADFSAERSG
jgi:hypothetical protein